MKKFTLAALPLLLIVMIAVAACGKTPGAATTTGTAAGAPNQVNMDAGNNFTKTAISISAGQQVKFLDDQASALHIICIGADGQCDAKATGPKDLLGNGFTINPGQEHDVTFDTAGTYKITCSVHPNMNMTVTVQ